MFFLLRNTCSFFSNSDEMLCYANLVYELSFLIYIYCRREVDVEKLCSILFFYLSVFPFLIKLIPAVCFTEFRRTQYFTRAFCAVRTKHQINGRTLLALCLHRVQRLNNVLEFRAAYLNIIFTWLVFRQVCLSLYYARRILMQYYTCTTVFSNDGPRHDL